MCTNMFVCVQVSVVSGWGGDKKGKSIGLLFLTGH